jgi:hypothetical protein
VRDRGERLLDQCRRSRDLCRRSRDLDRSLGLYRDVCDLSCSDLDCHSLDRDRHCSRGRSRLLEYIRESNSKPDSIKLAALAALEPIALGRKPVPRTQDPAKGLKRTGAIQMDIISVKPLR